MQAITNYNNAYFSKDLDEDSKKEIHQEIMKLRYIYGYTLPKVLVQIIKEYVLLPPWVFNFIRGTCAAPTDFYNAIYANRIKELKIIIKEDIEFYLKSYKNKECGDVECWVYPHPAVI